MINSTGQDIRQMTAQTRNTAWRCPRCATILKESSDAFRCTSCREQYPITESIPVFANTPRHGTRSLSKDEVSSLLREIDAHGWEHGLRREFLRLQGSQKEAALAEFVYESGVMSALTVGRPDDTSILCLGCTAGAVPFALARRFARVTVCDLSLGRLRVLERRSTEEEYRNLKFVCSGDTTYLPFPAAEFDFLLLDAMAIPGFRLTSTSLWREVCRLLKSSGHCLIAAENRRSWTRLFANARQNGRSGSWNLAFLRKRLSRVGLRCFQVYALLPDSQTPHTLRDLASKERIRNIGASCTLRKYIKSLCFHNKFFVPAFGLAARKGPAGSQTQSSNIKQTFVQEILSSIQRTLRDTPMPGGSLGSWHMQSRGSGRIVIMANLHGSANRLLVIKLPFRPVAERGDKRNAEALKLIHSSKTIPEQLKRLVPHHLTSGTCGGQAYFVEDAIDRVGADALNRSCCAWLKMSGMPPHTSCLPVEAQFGMVLLMLHQATARVVTLGETDLSSLRQSLVSVRMLTEEAGQHRVWDTIERFLERELLGQQLPLVWSHGDAGMCNMVLNRSGRLRGIIDWEEFDRNGLPLCDWIVLCMSTKTDEKYHIDWTWLKWALAGNEHVFFKCLPIEYYLKTLQLDRKLIPVLALSAWVQYVANQLPHNKFDSEWVRRTIHHVLELCKKTL